VLQEIEIRRVQREEEPRFQELVQTHHYLGALTKIGETLWYVATWQLEWVALLSFSAAALKCKARDAWIGWSYRQQYARLPLVANNTRFCILPDWHCRNLATRTLALCERRLVQDWQQTFGHPIVLLETFVDGQRHRGTLYRAANWVYVGDTRGYRRRQGGYTGQTGSPKKVFMRELQPQARALLCQPDLQPPYVRGAPKLMLTATQMKALPELFRGIPDPRRAAGRRHPIHVVLAIAVAACLCGARGYKQISEWAANLTQDALRRLHCRQVDGKFIVPSGSIIRDVLIRVDPEHLEGALNNWNAQFARLDTSLALDGKTMRNAIDDNGQQTHIMSAIGHESGICFAQKK
jgi:hypothetical protein